MKPAFKPGDVVRIMDDRAEVTKLQKGHGEWNEDMLDVSHLSTPNLDRLLCMTVCIVWTVQFLL